MSQAIQGRFTDPDVEEIDNWRRIAAFRYQAARMRCAPSPSAGLEHEKASGESAIPRRPTTDTVE